MINSPYSHLYLALKASLQHRSKSEQKTETGTRLLIDSFACLPRSGFFVLQVAYYVVPPKQRSYAAGNRLKLDFEVKTVINLDGWTSATCICFGSTSKGYVGFLFHSLLPKRGTDNDGRLQ